MSTNKSVPSENLLKQLSRRDFLRFCGLGLFGLILPQDWIESIRSIGFDHSKEKLLGRITRPGQMLFEEADAESGVIKNLNVDSLWSITNITVSENGTSPNRIWYELDHQGFAHSKYIQPVYRVENRTNTTIPEDGCLGEVTVPFVDAYRLMDENSSIAYRLYYASTYWVLKRDEDDAGEVWYQLLDDRNYTSFYARAENIRLVPDAELLPISPDVPFQDKKIEVDLATQTMTAYEGESIVYMSRISSGVWLQSTPKGNYRTFRKRPCRHMVNNFNDLTRGYDLPGVPWVSYFSSNGVAFHGAYWHNDFGIPHSHGCINLSPMAAKWVYLWTTPTVPPENYIHSDNNATRVIIH